VEDQAHQTSCLRLLATTVIVWNTVYIAEAVDCLKQAKFEIHDLQIARIYPMLLEHLNLLGEYRFPGEQQAVTRPGALPLRSLEEALTQLRLR
jgi:hypothetical protein